MRYVVRRNNNEIEYRKHRELSTIGMSLIRERIYR